MAHFVGAKLSKRNIGLPLSQLRLAHNPANVPGGLDGRVRIGGLGRTLLTGPAGPGAVDHAAARAAHQPQPSSARQSLQEILAKKGWIRASWLPREQNELADFLSKFRLEVWDFGLRPEVAEEPHWSESKC